ncbi:MAG: hypothetical protein DRJ03_16240 [Chloroflexi bacterium]|nr:MAG: hypothetical protein DRI81_07770 [Chloroflexota bacterium]RLC83741.1 MAG: hypothetical protein DRJ03_16240 [Chloroflexota bacterium]
MDLLRLEEQHLESQTLSSKHKKRFAAAQKWVIALSLLLLAMGLANLGKAEMALHYDGRLPDLPLTAPLIYLAAMGGFWGVAFTFCAVGLIRFRRWGRWGALATVTLYEIHVWINHLLFDANDYARQTRPRDMALTLLLLALVWGLLNWPSIQKVFE